MQKYQFLIWFLTLLLIQMLPDDDFVSGSLMQKNKNPANDRALHFT